MTKFFAAIAIAAIATASQAATVLGTLEGTPAVGLEGFTTYTLSIELEEGEAFRGVDATFTGAMNQVNPFSLSSIFTDANAAIGGVADVSQDSQFLFASGDVLAIGAEEGPELLRAAIQGVGGLTGTVPFAQIVIADGESVDADLAFDLGGAEAFIFQGPIGIPEPTTALLAGIAAVGFLARRK